MNDYESYKEIHAQYEQLRMTKEEILRHKQALCDFFTPAGSVVFIACGSSYWMSLSASKTMLLRAKKPSYAVKAGDIVLCPQEHYGLYDRPIFVCPSRSGTTLEVLEAVRLMRKAYPGARVLSITEYEDNQLASISDMNISIPFANEISVCQTRSFCCLYMACIVLAALLGDDGAFIDNVDTYLAIAPQLIARHEKMTRRLANPDTVKRLVTLGVGLQYGVCIEGAYIVTEMAEYPTNYYQLLEYRHGPIVTADKYTAVFICSGKSIRDHEAKMAHEVRETGARVYAVSEKNEDYADETFCLDGTFEKELIALHFVFVLQSFAHFFSIARGKNPDKPGHLVPFITY